MKLKNVWHEFISFIKLISVGSHKVIPVMLIGGFAKAAGPYLSLFFSARILNQIMEGDYENSIQSVGCMLIFQLIAGLIEKACFQTVSMLYESCKMNVNQQLTQKAFQMEYEAYEKQKTIDAFRKANVASISSGNIGDQVISSYEIIVSLFSLLYSLIFIGMLFFEVDEKGGNFFTSYASAAVLIMIYLLLFFLSGKLGKRIQNIYYQLAVRSEHFNSVTLYLQNAITEERNAKDIRIYSLYEILDLKLEEVGRKNIREYIKISKKDGIFNGVNMLLTQMAAGISYIFVAAKVIYGMIGIGDVLLYVGAINRAVGIVMKLIADVNSFMYRDTYLKGYDEFINRPPSSYEGTLPIEKRDDAQYEFEFHNVSFSYPDAQEEVLRNVNLRFTVGEKMAIVGRNGAGKTTLVKLLCRLYEPTSGEITLNGINIKYYDYKEYVSIFSVVFQDYRIFSLPLDENVAASESVEEERVFQVLEKVGLKERVEKMPDGIHSQLYNNNKKGIDLSGGEAQKLAIARALYKDGPFIILDEPTAALDPIAEAEIYENFNEMIENKTGIYISHRMSSCKFCDNIVVLDKGEIAERGSHEELMENGGIYAGLYNTQAQYYA